MRSGFIWEFPKIIEGPYNKAHGVEGLSFASTTDPEACKAEWQS